MTASSINRQFRPELLGQRTNGELRLALDNAIDAKGDARKEYEAMVSLSRGRLMRTSWVGSEDMALRKKIDEALMDYFGSLNHF